MAEGRRHGADAGNTFGAAGFGRRPNPDDDLQRPPSGAPDVPAAGPSGGTDVGEAETPLDPERQEDLGAQAPTADITAELEEAREEARRNLASAQRWQAEFENFKRRQTALAVEQSQRAGERLVEKLLPAIDDLERTIDHAVGGGDAEHLLKGAEAVRGQIQKALASEGVEVIDPFGQPFDPQVHHAVSQRDDTELPEHTVVEVFQKGYRLGNRVLRPAMVVVSTGGPERTA